MEVKREKIIRFYGNIDYALEVIKERKLAFVHASKINDPYDPNFSYLTEFECDPYLWKEQLERKNIDIQLSVDNFEKIILKYKEKLISIKNNYYVLCTYKKRYNIHLMPKDQDDKNFLKKAIYIEKICNSVVGYRIDNYDKKNPIRKGKIIIPDGFDGKNNISCDENELFSFKEKIYSLVKKNGKSIEDNDPDSFYMWSHYANGHRGVAIEFDRDLLSEWLKDKCGEKYSCSYGNILYHGVTHRIEKISALDLFINYIGYEFRLYSKINSDVEQENFIYITHSKDKITEVSVFSLRNDKRVKIPVQIKLPENIDLENFFTSKESDNIKTKILELLSKKCHIREKNHINNKIVETGFFKCSEYQEEREFRCILSLKNPSLMQNTIIKLDHLPIEAITGLYLGCIFDLEKDNSKELISIFRENFQGIKIRRSEKVQDDFKLVFNDLE